MLFLASSLPGQVPKVTADLKPVTLKARGTLSGGLQQLSLNLTSTIKEENGAWVITDVTETPFGLSTDTVTVEKGSLIVRKRSIQGLGQFSDYCGYQLWPTMQQTRRVRV